MAESVSDSKNFGDVLVREGLISEEQFKQGRDQYTSGERPLSRIFVEMGAISEGEKIGILQQKYQVPVLNMKDVRPRPEAAAHIPREICEKYRMVPIRIENNRLVLAMEDPTDPHAVAAAEAASAIPVKTYVARAGDITEAISQLPAVEQAPSKEAGSGKKIFSILTLFLIALGPPLGFLAALVFHKPVQNFYYGTFSEPFEQVLFLILAWCAWAIVAYWIHDVIFGESREEEY